MTLESINVGNLANDGTGDDLRQAFVKVNNNFVYLEAQDAASVAGVNVGSLGAGIFKDKVGTNLNFKKLVGGTNVTITDAGETLTLDGPNSINQLLVISDSGTVTVTNGQTITLSGGEGLQTSVTGQTLNIALDTTNILSRDTAPTLSANLNANNKNIINAGTVNSDTFVGALTGLVNGYDLNVIGPYFQGFDFGQLRPNYNSAIEFILAESDVDFGAISGAGVNLANADIGTFT